MSVRRQFFVPETLQTSAMDCGPAALKSLLAGLDVPVDYQRLRDACQTGADGTSIDALEDLCASLGLEAFQEMAPAADAAAVFIERCPCIVVVKGPAGAPHFVVLWRVVGSFVQIMDPARGRRWLSAASFSRELYMHSQAFADDEFGPWFETTEWKTILARRLERIGAPRALANALGSARRATALDGAARLVERLVSQRALARSAGAAAVEQLAGIALADGPPVIPASLSAAATGVDGRAMVRGSVFLVVRRSASVPLDATGKAAGPTPALRSILGPDAPTPLALLAQQLTPNLRRVLALCTALAVMLGFVALFEMIILRAAFNADSLLALPQQRLAGTAVYAGLIGLLLLLETSLGLGIARLGRALELRMRLALLRKLPRLPDRYFRSRPMSDVTHRSQGLFEVKPLPGMLVTLAKQAVDIVVTVAALCILHPRGIPYTLAALSFGLAAPLLGMRLRRPVEYRVQSHASALGQLYLDVLLGLVPLRNHGGQLAVRTKQDEHLVAWRQESERSIRLLSITDAVQSIGILAAVVLLLLGYLREESQSALLLMAFWALRLPVQARALSAGIQRIPRALASISRIAEPLTATETPPDDESGDEQTKVLAERSGIALRLRGVRALLGTQEVLSDVSLDIEAGQRIAIVGSSGAGKSSLFAALLGLLDHQSGQILADGRPIASYDLGRFRRETVWVDPSVQLWNRPLLANLHFGNPPGARKPLATTLDDVHLTDLLERLPMGLSTPLGESGVRVSGGEGQRVRLGRALLRRGARLVLLDEAFRGLERPTRRELSRRVRELAGKATVLEVTHDVSDTLDFDRVLVIEDGKLVEDGVPSALLADARSRYAELVNADRNVQQSIWNAPHWKRIVIGRGTVVTHEADEAKAVVS